MLYLVRTLNESIIINNTIELKIIEIRGKKVKLGFTSPSDCSILRKELSDKIMKENHTPNDVNIHTVSGLRGLMSRFKLNKKD
jgi:carbon storage regulator